MKKILEFLFFLLWNGWNDYLSTISYSKNRQLSVSTSFSRKSFEWINLFCRYLKQLHAPPPRLCTISLHIPLNDFFIQKRQVHLHLCRCKYQIKSIFPQTLRLIFAVYKANNLSMNLSQCFNGYLKPDNPVKPLFIWLYQPMKAMNISPCWQMRLEGHPKQLGCTDKITADAVRSAFLDSVTDLKTPISRPPPRKKGKISVCLLCRFVRSFSRRDWLCQFAFLLFHPPSPPYMFCSLSAWVTLGKGGK